MRFFALDAYLEEPVQRRVVKAVLSAQARGWCGHGAEHHATINNSMDAVWRTDGYRLATCWRGSKGSLYLDEEVWGVR